ncbi:MOSC domain-containing protein [Stutzerimonas marianensis]|uniref:MOSC domain-containing protein n=1 Tax=Stutzerimonas marianensis TaxID=2929513 RepID=UPI003C2D5EEB
MKPSTDRIPAGWTVEGPFLRDALLPLSGSRRPSAMDKQPASVQVWLDQDGLRGDRVADRRFHGGPDRSLCHYPTEHYAYWRMRYRHLGAIGAAAFGENLSTTGLTEHEVCVGDRYQWGEALIEVSQPRSPCAKLDRRHAAPGLSREMAQSGRTGWLYRTLVPGYILPGARLQLIARPNPDASILRVWRGFIDSALGDDELAWLAGLPALAGEYRLAFRHRRDARRRQQDQGTLF